jgi:hypothetical protein
MAGRSLDTRELEQKILEGIQNGTVSPETQQQIQLFLAMRTSHSSPGPHAQIPPTMARQPRSSKRAGKSIDMKKSLSVNVSISNFGIYPLHPLLS